VYVNDTAYDKVANTLPSAGSMSTDLYGMATLDACLQIIKRLQPIKDSLPPDAELKDIAKKAVAKLMSENLFPADQRPRIENIMKAALS
jgi:xanthine dehydrogenase molybdopterin-binding subunit B